MPRPPRVQTGLTGSRCDSDFEIVRQMRSARHGRSRSVALAALATCLAPAALVGRAEGAFPGGNGKIVLADSRGRIYTIKADGSHRRRLTPRHFRVDGPAYSADGGSIAFGHFAGSYHHIYLMTASGGKIR